MEDLFHPVLVFNNKGGRDAELLRRYFEPSWNNPVIRYLDKDGKDVIPRKDRVWTTGGTAGRMVAALKAAGQDVPEWLRLVAVEEGESLHAATFAMPCFWEGEARLGNVDGVVGTRAGWLDGDEVVEVSFDPGKVEFGALVDTADGLGCATSVYAPSQADLEVARDKVGKRARIQSTPAKNAKDSDRKFALRQTAYRHLPLTPAQATKVNAALRLGTDPARWLSPRQTQLLRSILDRLRQEPTALDEFVCPDRIADLPAYAARLATRLGR